MGTLNEASRLVVGFRPLLERTSVFILRMFHFAPIKKTWNDSIPQHKYPANLMVCSHGFKSWCEFGLRSHPQHGFYASRGLSLRSHGFLVCLLQLLEGLEAGRCGAQRETSSGWVLGGLRGADPVTVGFKGFYWQRMGLQVASKAATPVLVCCW